MLEIRILNGLHQGASLALDDERITLGSSLDADIEVIDPGIKERHCVIEYLENKKNWYVQALEGEITIGIESKCANVIEVTQDLVIKIGAIYIGFFDPEAEWDFNKYSRPEINPMSSKRQKLSFNNLRAHFGLSVVVGCLLTYSFAGEGKSSSDASAPSSTNEKSQALSSIESSTSTVSDLGINLESELKHMLRQRGLLKKISVSGEGHQWALTGSLSTDELSTISRMVDRFKVTYPDVELVNSTKSYARALPFEIRSISSGMYAYILTTGGQRIYIGDSIQGFTLKKIDKDKILFSGESDVELLW